MCGRITQYRRKDAYAAGIGPEWQEAAHVAGDEAPRFNVAPGTRPWMMHLLREAPAFERMHWGYRPSWAQEKGIPLAINARLEKAATGRYFKHMWRAGRVIIPADGWYEWTGDKGHKQPWHIRLKNDAPMYLAAIANLKPDREPGEGDGFVIVTAAADAGMVDVHDRRPVVLAPEDAALWMDNSLPPEQAEQIARSLSLPAEAFDWYPVSTAVNRVGHDDAALIAPVELA